MKKFVVFIVAFVLYMAVRGGLGIEYDLFSDPFDLLKLTVDIGIFVACDLLVWWLVESVIPLGDIDESHQ